ncbi:hypothetical protein CAPTEDRAFT_201807 [Capitella teleta]|uniref:Uncharacterized protein n=1 Tax=Capitella teleta TaxID=283909 RepID=R7UE64_CAPTE|nr:hypothetical protein CAPTEDRAFT_201807 [Capitella teleta]|eukprot:ELU01547.1 hypothetical protein CAPTEDRAFT_201807 [Capitella teleta]
MMSDAKVREGLDACVEDADSGDKECSSFQAEQKIKAKNKSKNLDVTGVFGSICKHEIPMLFMDLHHGEFKEMTPSHRVDLLTDLMLHYGKRKKDCLERTLETKLKAVTMEETLLRQKISEFSALYRGTNLFC